MTKFNSPRSDGRSDRRRRNDTESAGIIGQEKAGVETTPDPPTVEEIIAVMREAHDDRHGWRLRPDCRALARGGLRVQEALALGERDLDPRRGSLLVRNGGRRREIGMDAWG